jgi:hypothetical protein
MGPGGAPSSAVTGYGKRTAKQGRNFKCGTSLQQRARLAVRCGIALVVGVTVR